MLNREDMNKYNTTSMEVPSGRAEGELSQTAGATAKTIGGMVWKAVKTVLCILFLSGMLVFISVATFIFSFKESVPPNISAMKLKFSSFVYLDNADGTSTEYMTFFSDENRVWTPLSEIPQAMKDAQIAIEDKRFYEHHGVDWKSTAGAVLKLFTHTGGGGGSTLTQQLIKNLTNENQVSILRKVKEIFTALNLEGGYTTEDGERKPGYSKDEILEAYLNVVNYGGQCQGVEAAANCYFDKSIGECSIAECALIAGITQNPYQYNPLIFPEESKGRAQTVLDEMEDQGKITQSEYQAAIAELQTMKFVGAEIETTDVDENQDTEKWNWYIDTMFEDIAADLMEKYGWAYDYAVDQIYNSGLEIHCAMNLKMQTDIERFFLGSDNMPEDPNTEIGFFMMDYSGKVMAVVGSREERTGIRLWNNATESYRQTGSAIKPISAYSVGLNTQAITYGTVLKDEPIPNILDDPTEKWPANFSLEYEGTMNVDHAIEVSQNAPAAWLCQTVTPEACFDWLTNKLHFQELTEEDSHSLAAMALGGLSKGATVREMTAAFQIFGNGGYYNKPYTYNYIKDHDGNIILDNRDKQGEQVMTADNATVMNKLLHRPTEGINGTATGIMQDLPVDVFGKTGTTDDMYDYWFIGGTPFCVAGIWNGYPNPGYLEDSTIHKYTWRAVMQYMLDNYDWSDYSYNLSDDVVQATFCRSSGLLAGGSCYDTATGWYAPDNVPRTCNGGSDHIAYGKKAASPSPSPSPSITPTIEPSITPSISPSIPPTVSPSPSELPPDSSDDPSSGGESSEVEPPPSEAPTTEPSVEPEPPPPPPTEEPTPTLPPDSSTVAPPEPAGE